MKNILRLAASGLLTEQVAMYLGISGRTIRSEIATFAAVNGAPRLITAGALAAALQYIPPVGDNLTQTSGLARVGCRS